MSRFAMLDAVDLDEAVDPDATLRPKPRDEVDDTLRPKTHDADPLINPLFWIDLEMTGLDAREHHILEVAIICTDGELERTVDGPNIVIHHDDAVLAGMNVWSMKQHGESGLTERVRHSSTSLTDAESELISFVGTHRPAEGRAMLAGACVYKDLEFIDVHMPRLRALLSHRVVDVSTVRHLCRMWNPSAARQARGELSDSKACMHRALDDVRYSINELRCYRKHCFRQQQGASTSTSGNRRGGKGSDRAVKGDDSTNGKRVATGVRANDTQHPDVSRLVSALDATRVHA